MSDIYGSKDDDFTPSASSAWNEAKSSLKQSNPDTPAYSRDFDGAGAERKPSHGGGGNKRSDRTDQ